jgi:Omp85 superfamily domain
LLLLLPLGRARAQSDPPPDPRGPAPNPAQGDTYDGRPRLRSAGDKALMVPRVLLFPFRLLLWGIEPPSRNGINFIESHHVYQRVYSVFTSDDGQIGLRPTFSWIRSFRASFGAYLFDDKLLGAGTQFNLDVAGGVDVVHAAAHARPTRIGRRVQLHLDSVFDRRNDFLFTGLGATSPLQVDHPSSRYLASVVDVGGRLELAAHQMVAFTFGGFFGLRRFGDSETYAGDRPIQEVYCTTRLDGTCQPGTVNDTLVPGFNNGTQFLRTSAALHVDLRDQLVRPTLGLILDAEADYTHGLGSDDSDYFRVYGAASIIVPLWGGNSHVLVLRGVTRAVFQIGDTPVPFFELPTLGGPDDLRGFRWQEFRDYSSLLATAEYRWPLILWADAALFVDYGGVFGKNYAGFGAKQMQPDVGLGIRLHTQDRFYVRLQVAHGFGNGWQIYLSGQNLP